MAMRKAIYIYIPYTYDGKNRVLQRKMLRSDEVHIMAKTFFPVKSV